MAPTFPFMASARTPVSAPTSAPELASSRHGWGALGAAFAGMVSLLLWDASGADLPLAHWFGTPFGFPLRLNWFLVEVLHQGARAVSGLLLALLLAGIWWPRGVLRRIPRAARVQLVLTALVSVTLVLLLKDASRTSCPWDLQEFGGVARYVSHWAPGINDGGPGGCFPAGHASAAFALFGGYFVFRRPAPVVARRWLALVLVAGLVLGIGQQMRGAHYMSHTFWTAWVCWVVALIIDRAASDGGRLWQAWTRLFSC